VYTLEGTNTWIVGEDPSLVIDPGPADDAHLVAVAREAGEVAAICLTHGHEDHAEGASRLSGLTGAKVHAFRPDEGGVRLRDEAVVEAGAVRLRALHTPGHTPDHLAFALDSMGALFSGDAVLGRGTSIIDPPEGDLVAYLASLERLRVLAPRWIYPGHGPLIFDGVAKLDEYLAHRAAREEQVLDALAEGTDEVDAMVSTIYVAYPMELRPLAARSVLAHLHKLEEEGLVERERRAGRMHFRLAGERRCLRCGGPVRGRAKWCARCSTDLLQEGPGFA